MSATSALSWCSSGRCENEVRCQVCHTPPKPGYPQYDSLKDRWKVRTVAADSKKVEQEQVISMLNTYLRELPPLSVKNKNELSKACEVSIVDLPD